MNALEIIQQAASKLGFEKPATIEVESDINAQRLVGQLNSILVELVVNYDWQKLIKEGRFKTESNLYHDNPNPRGYDINLITGNHFKCFMTRYLYNITTRQRIEQITLDRYELDKFYQGCSYPRFTLQNDMICFSPDIPAGQEISFFYKSKYSVIDKSKGVGQWEYREYFSKNCEESVFDSGLLILGIIWKYKDEMGFDYAESYRSYEKHLEKLKNQDSVRTNILGNRGRYCDVFGIIPDTYTL